MKQSTEVEEWVGLIVELLEELIEPGEIGSSAGVICEYLYTFVPPIVLTGDNGDVVDNSVGHRYFTAVPEQGKDLGSKLIEVRIGK